MKLGPLDHQFKVGDPVKHRYLMFGGGGLVNDATSRATVIGVTTDLLTVALRNGRNTKMTWKREDVEYLPPPPAPPDPPGFTAVAANNDSRKAYHADPMPLWLWGVVAGLAVDCLLTVVWIAQHGARPF